MDIIKKNDVLKIQCYKHNGDVYRNWDETLVLEVNEDYIVCANNRVKVTEIDNQGRINLSMKDLEVNHKEDAE